MRSRDRVYAYCVNSFWLSVAKKDLIGESLLNTGWWDKPLSVWMKKHVKPGAVCIDAGSNVGYFTEIMARLAGPTGKVYAIDANETVTSAYLASQNLNDYTEVAEIFVVTAALDEFDDQTRTFQYPESNEGAATMLDDFAFGYGTAEILTFTAPTARLDSIAPPGPIDLLKIDLEGSEPTVFRGAGSVLDRVDRIILDVHPAHSAEFLDELSDRFRARDLDGKPLLLRRPPFGDFYTVVLEQR